MWPLPANVNRGLIRVLCAFLLFAQQAGLTHVVSHFTAAQLPADVQVMSQPQRDTGVPALSGVCAFDVAFGQVLGGGPASQHACFSPAASAQVTLDHTRAFATADALTARSRGPPVLL